MTDYDVCIIGSGAGGGPLAYRLSQAGYDVVVLEKGPFLTAEDFRKDELANIRLNSYKSSLKNEYHIIETCAGIDQRGETNWQSYSTQKNGTSFWSGNMVGGATNLMSGFFHRLKPEDFRLASEFGVIEGANVVDWPISYDDLEPYYAMVEDIVGVSGEVKQHPNMEPRSTEDFPYPPTHEHSFSALIDKACESMQLHSLVTPRAVLSKAKDEFRGECEYSGYCGKYGCTTGAKGTSLQALLHQAIATGRCIIKARSKATRLFSDAHGRATHVEYVDENNQRQKIGAKIFVVACQPVETSRLLLSSTGSRHGKGIGNQYDHVGKNLLFSTCGTGAGEFYFKDYDTEFAKRLREFGPFVNRYLQDWYFIDDKEFGRAKGGMLQFLLPHPNPIARASLAKRDCSNRLIWGEALKSKLRTTFTEYQTLEFEIFSDWQPIDDCFVTLDTHHKDKWGSPVAKVRMGTHHHDYQVCDYILKQGKKVLQFMQAANVRGLANKSPPVHLQAGGCRFGTDPSNSVLDPECRVHSAENVFVSDSSWMPTGGSVPYTFTIYANAFRVADSIKQQL